MIVYESVGVWNLFDGTQVPINACTVLTVADDGKFTDQRIYVDNTPVEAALAREARGTPDPARAEQQLEEQLLAGRPRNPR